jgi:putative CocE/NonD family hydrolase
VTKKAGEGGASEADMATVLLTLAKPQEYARWLPLADMPLMHVGSLFSYAEMLGILRAAGGVDCTKINVPVLMVGGWYDIDPLGSDHILQRVWQQGGPAAREHSAVIWGPWEHCIILEAIGERSFGPFAGIGFGLADAQLRFFDRHLRGTSVEVPRATWFAGGVDTWKTAASWPPAGVTAQTWYLASGSGANGVAGDGVLSASPSTSAGEDVYRYDPHDPVPSFGGRYFRIGGSLPGPYDQRRVEVRDDVLVYTSAVLEAPVEVAGNARVVLQLSTDVVDTDLAVKLCDVAADGLSQNISDNFVRLRWREGTDAPVWLVPGEEFEFSVELSPVGHVFDVGHRLRLQVTSSNFPAYDRNMNTDKAEGEDPVGVVATTRVRFGPDGVSRLELDVL